MITADQLFLHAVGDYVIQSDWMARHKTTNWVVAGFHASTYTLPFLLLTSSPRALLLIFATHFVIDHWRLARYICWLKNHLAPRDAWDAWKDCTATGYHNEAQPWLTVWLMIITDNLMHIACNALALRYL